MAEHCDRRLSNMASTCRCTHAECHPGPAVPATRDPCAVPKPSAFARPTADVGRARRSGRSPSGNYCFSCLAHMNLVNANGFDPNPTTGVPTPKATIHSTARYTAGQLTRNTVAVSFQESRRAQFPRNCIMVVEYGLFPSLQGTDSTIGPCIGQVTRRSA